MAYLILILISSFSHWRWFNGFSILASGDWYYQSPTTLREFFSYPAIWTNTSTGSVNIGVSFFPFQFFYGLFSYLGFGYGLSERILFMWPIVLVSILSSYILIKKNTQNTIAALIGVLVYSYNVYFYSIQTGHLTLMAAFAFAPLVLFFMQKAMEKKSMIQAFLAGLFLFVVSFYEFRVMYIVVWVLFFYYLYYQFILEKKITLKSLFKNAIYAFVPILIVGLLNLYWLYAFSKLGTLTTNAIFSRMLFGNEFLNINYALTLFHPFWTGGKTTEFIVQSIPLLFWLIPLFAFLGLLLQRRNKNILFFGFIALLGILLAKQVGQPFTGLYQWLYESFPGFNAFREASKFFFLIALGYSVLIAALVDWLWKNWVHGKVKIYGKYFLTLLIVGMFLWNAKPAITGELGTLFVPRHIPDDYLVVKNFILKQKDYFRTFWIPTYSRWSIYVNNHPEISAVDQINGSWQEFIEKEKNADNFPESEIMIKLLQSTSANKLLDASSIKYIFVPLQDTANDDDFFRFYGKDRGYYIEQLDKLTYLKKINIGTKDIVIYENEGFMPHIYATNSSLNDVLVNSKLQNLKSTYDFISPNEYRVHLSNITSPVFLQFSESYHPDWRIKVGEFHWWEVLTNKNYFLSDSIHSKNDAQLNSYKIDPKVVCGVDKDGCTRNSDGSYDINMTLYFSPQSYLYFGGIISLTTLVGILGYFGFKLIKSIKFLKFVKKKKE